MGAEVFMNRIAVWLFLGFAMLLVSCAGERQGLVCEESNNDSFKLVGKYSDKQTRQYWFDLYLRYWSENSR